MKKQSKRNAMSAVELELISGVFLPIMSVYLRIAEMIGPAKIEITDAPQRR